jgi:hypothetical protein
MIAGPEGLIIPRSQVRSLPAPRRCEAWVCFGRRAPCSTIYQLRLRFSIPGQAQYEVDHAQWTMNSAPPAVGDVLPDDPNEVAIDWSAVIF